LRFYSDYVFAADQRGHASRPVLVTNTNIHFWKTDIHFWKIATLWRQEANLWREDASNNLQSSFKVGGWAILSSPVPRQT
jgi:hypothetical protein